MNLLPQIARGDIRALELLYQEQKTRIYRLALSLTGDPYLAEDITQDTFLRVQEKAPSYHRDISETAWIVTIARNLSYDYLRRRSREAPHESAAELAESSAEEAPEASRFVFLELLKDLTPSEKETVCLRILADLPWKEIGQITGQNPEAERKRYSRALVKLRGQIKQ